MKSIIDTKRLYLREMNESDYDALYAILADSDIMQHYPYTFDEKRVKNWIFRNRERYDILGFGLWAVCLKGSGEMIGDCGLSMQVIHGVIRPEIGYHIRGDMQRNGYAKEAAIAVRDWAFQHTPFNILYSYMKYTNEPSARTAKAWGCHFVEEYEDEANERTRVFAMTREEWKKQHEHLANKIMDIRIKECDEADERIGAFISREFSDYGTQRGINLNYDEFCFTAEDDEGNILGAITGRALYDEVHIQDLIVRQDCRKTGLGSLLMARVEKRYKGRGYAVMSVTTYGFQAPAFYSRLGFQLDFVRSAEDPDLSKYYFSKKL